VLVKSGWQTKAWNWRDRDWRDPGYFRDLARAVRDRTVLDSTDSRPLMRQLGSNLIERADIVLREESATDLRAAALEALKAVWDAVPDDLVWHLRTAFNAFPHQMGLYNTNAEDIFLFWETVTAELDRLTVNANKKWLLARELDTPSGDDFGDEFDTPSEGK
jgi:hypothetical protein